VFAFGLHVGRRLVGITTWPRRTARAAAILQTARCAPHRDRITGGVLDVFAFGNQFGLVIPE
jgi:hypothetical protein